MANFTKGQRVRIVSYAKREDLAKGRSEPHSGLVGAQATVTSFNGGNYGVTIDGVRSQHPTGEFLAFGYQLEPLIDPKAEEFIERIRRMGREPAPRKADEIQIGGNGLPQYPQIGSRT